MLLGNAPIVDIGCGRGELLDLLAESGNEALGIDIDAGMVERCRQKGHRVEQTDLANYLSRQPADSIGALFSAQLIEHLRYEELQQFLALSIDKLRPGGVFIAETPNPHSLAALKTFWVDLTHEKPIFPETLLALCRAHGFSEATIIFPNGSGDLDRDRQIAGEYAVVARKAVAVEA